MRGDAVAHFVYMLLCQNGSYYTGYTTDVHRRYQEHQKGTSKCRYTRSFPPQALAAYWVFESRSDALSAECRIKALSKQEKVDLVASWQSGDPVMD